MSSGYLFYF